MINVAFLWKNKLRLILHKSYSILIGCSYSGQFGLPLATWDRAFSFDGVGASIGKHGHRVSWGLHTCSTPGWSWDSPEQPARRDKQITLPDNETNSPRKNGQDDIFSDKSQKMAYYIFLKRCLPHNRNANFFKSPKAKSSRCSHTVGARMWKAALQ